MNANQKLLSTSLLIPNGIESGWVKFKSILVKYGKIVFGILGFLVILISSQILVIAIADRLGVSPKTSVLVSSSLFILGFLGLAIYSRLVLVKERGVFIQQKGLNINPKEPICKILMIRKKGV
jgi:hypothetical protein